MAPKDGMDGGHYPPGILPPGSKLKGFIPPPDSAQITWMSPPPWAERDLRLRMAEVDKLGYDRGLPLFQSACRLDGYVYYMDEQGQPCARRNVKSGEMFIRTN